MTLGKYLRFPRDPLGCECRKVPGEGEQKVKNAADGGGRFQKDSRRAGQNYDLHPTDTATRGLQRSHSVKGTPGIGTREREEEGRWGKAGTQRVMASLHRAQRWGDHGRHSPSVHPLTQPACGQGH